KGTSSFDDNRLIQLSLVGVKPGANGKGVVVVMKLRSLQGKPTTCYLWITLHKNAPATLGSIRPRIHKNRYCPDLCMASIHVARAIPRSQKPVMVTRKRPLPPRAP
ncbi:RL28 protein, partial [Crocuta crocuta]